MNHDHIPVLLKEVISFLPKRNSELFIDATFGAGGYSEGILSNIPDSFVLGIDRDPEVNKFINNSPIFANTKRFKLVIDTNSNLKNICNHQNIDQVDGVVFDLGVSTMQLKTPERGFSFMENGPLDMRMGHSQITAEDIVNNYSEAQIADIIYFYGEESWARKIAKAIVLERIKFPIKTTKHLADIVKIVINERRIAHPATKTFQALRIFVNKELEELEQALEAAVDLLSPGGVVVVVSFHSLEDRIVKGILKHFAVTCSQDSKKKYRIITPSPITPDEDELYINRRARSAKLRALIRET